MSYAEILYTSPRLRDRSNLLTLKSMGGSLSLRSHQYCSCSALQCPVTGACSAQMCACVCTDIAVKFYKVHDMEHMLRMWLDAGGGDYS